jgi:holo-[acyl-carrier protein] synthase
LILGVGTDLCDIRRIERTLGRFGERFERRVFTDEERRNCRRRPNPAAAYALRYAAKEACAKALGTGFRDGVFWRDLVVGNHSSGKPYMVLTGGAGQVLAGLTPLGMEARIDLSLSDEYPMAQAMVVISAIPGG